MPQDPFYTVEHLDGGFTVYDGNGSSVILCSDETNAQHYCVLLNQAYNMGFKNGCRKVAKDN